MNAIWFGPGVLTAADLWAIFERGYHLGPQALAID